MNCADEFHVETVEDVRAFFEYLVNKRNCNFHPDDDFAEYVNKEDGSPSFSPDEIICFNRLMQESFTVCSESDESIYEVKLEALGFDIGVGG